MVRGLLLVISDKSKIWRFRYERPITKKRNDLSLGAFPEISLQQEYRSLLANSIDPHQHRQEQERQAKAIKHLFACV